MTFAGTSRRTSALVRIDEASSKGEGLMNEDLSGSAASSAWMLDGATDVGTTFRPDPRMTGAYWLVHQVDAMLASDSGEASHGSLLGKVASQVDAKLRRLGLDDSHLPPACSAGIVTLDSPHINVSLVGDVFIFKLEGNRLLSDGRFGRNERKAVQGQVLGGTDGQLGIAQRRQGYIRGHNDQWILANNPSIGQHITSERWECQTGDHILLATDGFARAVTDYGLFDNWLSLTLAVMRNGAESEVDRIRAYERVTRDSRSHFKRADDVCVAMYRVED
jgi:hypothetical protein